MERTFLMIKPDAVQRNLIGEIVSRIENKGLKLVGGKLIQVPTELAEKHYSEHEGKPFYEKLISFPILAFSSLLITFIFPPFLE